MVENITVEFRFRDAKGRTVNTFSYYVGSVPPKDSETFSAVRRLGSLKATKVHHPRLRRRQSREVQG